MTRGWALALAILTCWFVHRCVLAVKGYRDPDLHSPGRGDRVIDHVFFLLTGRKAPDVKGDDDHDPEGDDDLEDEPKTTKRDLGREAMIYNWIYDRFDEDVETDEIIRLGAVEFGIPEIEMRAYVEEADRRYEE